jgi:uncharacterized protein with NAD-binding domain and iron-sulfur cluster
MEKYDIVIFGGGIAGLTVAHELSKYNLKIAVIEKESILGGMARSDIYKSRNNLRTEHSWRGFAPFYNNTFQIMKEIKLDSTKTVFDTLKPNISFNTLENIPNSNKNTTLYDNIIIIYWMIYHIVSGNIRSEKNKEISFSNLISSKLSNNGKKKYIEYIGPGLGLDPYSASIYHIGKYVEMLLFETNNNTNWYFTDRPSSEAWFDPWYQHLINNRVEFYLSSELQELQFQDNNAIIAKTSTKSFSADRYIIALNPYAVDALYKNNKLGVDSELEKFNNITRGEEHIQISFRIAFDEKIIINNRDAFVFADSNLNITLYPQDNFWNTKLFDSNNTNFPMTNIKSLWSGTACVTYKKSKLYPDKLCDELTINQFLDEVLFEINECKELNDYVLKYNNKDFNKFNIIDKEVWYEWEFKDNRLRSRNKKWVNTLSNNSRPLYKTKYSNVYIAGSHCDTGLSIWSMESAVESGKRCSINIINDMKLDKSKIKLYTHSRPYKSLYKLDDMLYNLNLPNILDLSINFVYFFIVFIILYIIVIYMKDKKVISL